MTKLAILIPTIENEREELLHRCMSAIQMQIDRLGVNDDVVILVNPSEKYDKDNPVEKLSHGYKRNALIEAASMAGAEYICFMDDDDLPGENYIERMLEGINQGFDCCELWGQIYWNGVPGKPFHHSIEYEKWFEDDKFYYRTVNHLNCVKLSLIKDIPFPHQGFGEDGQWSEKVKAAGVLKTMYPIKEIIYHYFCGTIKHKI